MKFEALHSLEDKESLCLTQLLLTFM